MAPLRRYLRLTATSVLEVRIYLDNPADGPRWLITDRDPALPRVMDAVRPLVLPKLREENERAKGKKGGKGKRKGVKDVVIRDGVRIGMVQLSAGAEDDRSEVADESGRCELTIWLFASIIDDFDVSIFLTEMSTSHEVLLRRRMFVAKGARLKSNSGKMTGTREEPAEVGDDEATEAPVLMRRESEEEKPALAMQDIPAASTAHEGEAEDENAADHQAGEKNPVVVSDDSGSEDAFQRQDPASEHEEQEDKKKMAMNTSYDGFRIYGRILCLVVKRKGGAKGKQAGNGAQGQGGGGGAMMEEWIASTQVGRDEEVVGDE